MAEPLSAPTAGSAGLDERIAARERIVRELFDREAEGLARTCHAMARAFARGGTLIPFGTGAAATDAAHAAVEFMHPVIVGKRALPALAPTSDVTGASTLARLARPDDIALAISHGEPDAATAEFIAEARRLGILTIAITGRREEAGDAEHGFAVPSDDPAVVQEAQETAYHVLWELVHVFFEQPGLLEDELATASAEHPEACITCGDVAVEVRVAEVQGPTAIVEREGAFEQVAVDLIEHVQAGDRLLCHAGVALERLSSRSTEPAREASATDPTDFLYPFQASGTTDLDSVLTDVEASTRRKAEDVIELRGSIDTGAIAACARQVRERLDRGGDLISFGNGGSSTDAQDLATDALARGWPAVSLNNDVATITAVGNDVGFENAFSRQLIPLGRAHDVAVAISTSGNSDNLIAGLEEARRRNMLTVGIAGYDGGRMAGLGWLDHLFIVRSDYIPRIQEAQATIYHLLLEAVGERA
ncbi:MAG TPA: SIS domain-containing protein [Solirubrobacterales bacterium]|nr:SIS domain-containing protein [Solirubrobacterales bacterium]